ncbi:DUF5684 domain-containing protein [Persicobacter sp. CCB-QB2]|uniref:DUF5684 domain-containing protein n=1 Tax=Persicobacter sp. CCB-QB2 TaxID=1561025 RepID=UPI0006A954A1|nr:DUF5684 domain-containing protein [Persicobacter sp. CCB-QB2]
MENYENAAGSGLVMIVYFALIVIQIVALWKIFEKAGQEGWKAIIPIYNIIILLEIIGKPWWWLLLLFLPIINIFIYVMMCHLTSQSYGKGIGFTLGLIFLSPIFYLILGLDSSIRYMGPAGATAQTF